MIRVLIADDHGIVREGLKQLFALGSDITVAAEAGNGTEVIQALGKGGIDVILLDMTMPGISGATLIARLRAHDTCPPILVLSMHNELQVARRALSAGASGYVTKDSDPKTLMSAVHKVAAGGRFIDPVLAEKMAFDVNGSEEREPHELLSERELDILRRSAFGDNLLGSHHVDNAAERVKACLRP